MNKIVLSQFEDIVRSTQSITNEPSTPEHPFENRGFAALFPDVVKRLFDDGHYSQSSFEAYKHIEQILRDKSGDSTGFGVSLIKSALNGDNPKVILSAPDGQNYGKFRDNFVQMLSGAFGNIRNPKGHKLIDQTPDDCLDELTMAAYFARIIDPASPIGD